MRIVKELSCPVCGVADFEEGPSAGASLHLRCKNCGYFMNVTVLAATAGPGTTAPRVGYLILDEQ